MRTPPPQNVLSCLQDGPLMVRVSAQNWFVSGLDPPEDMFLCVCACYD